MPTLQWSSCWRHKKRLTGNHAASFKGEPTQASEHALKIPVCQDSYPGPKKEVFCVQTLTLTPSIVRIQP